ncbi:hypothetical protein RHSIM_Rhsim05G0039900 [Rhododendron simsii]|uniref:Uncharacterized protein n=1 Tax=Rhododendron simsii TaxID=118357 RepID=A0A834LPI0_RHOSS|nr:hypothetical protein RHSIM_Rhsim05G0039900 [Rhododendron simsii]
METQDLSREEPCPNRIFVDMGRGFGFGAVGGSAFHFIKGLCNSPGGHRLAGACQAVRSNAPRVGRIFAVWGGLFSAFDCAMVYARRKEDLLNTVAAGAATGGLLQLRQGLRAASRSALYCGVSFALIEGNRIFLDKYVIAQRDMPVVIQDKNPNKSSEMTSSSSFGGEEEQEEEEKKGFTTEVLESFDSPVPPTSEFK